MGGLLVSVSLFVSSCYTTRQAGRQAGREGEAVLSL